MNKILKLLLQQKTVPLIVNQSVNQNPTNFIMYFIVLGVIVCNYVCWFDPFLHEMVPMLVFCFMPQ